MFKAYKSTHTITKVFIWATLLLFVPIFGYYGLTLHGSLTMDPNSFNCTQDSMMMEFCHNPFGQSARWAFGIAFMTLWPAILAWAIFGAGVLVRYVLDFKKAVKASKDHPRT